MNTFKLLAVASVRAFASTGVSAGEDYAEKLSGLTDGAADKGVETALDRVFPSDDE